MLKLPFPNNLGMANRGETATWADLPTELLESIAKRLGTIDFIMFGCVCKSWMSLARSCKQAFMASQPPLLLLLLPKQRYASNICHFQEIMNSNRLYRTTLPFSMADLSCLGFSCGYLILQDKSDQNPNPKIWILNPFTGHHLCFPRPGDGLSQVIVVRFNSNPLELVLIGYRNSDLYFYRGSDSEWTMYTPRASLAIVGMIIIKKKIHVLFRNSMVGILDLRPDSPPQLNPLSIKNKIQWPRLVTNVEYDSDYTDSLLITASKSIYALNWSEMVWEDLTTDFVDDWRIFMDGSEHGGIYAITKHWPEPKRSWRYCEPKYNGSSHYLKLRPYRSLRQGIETVRICHLQGFWWLPQLSVGTVEAIDG